MNKKRLKFIAVPTVLLVVGILFVFMYLGTDLGKEAVQSEPKQNEEIKNKSNKGKSDDTDPKKNKDDESDSKSDKDVEPNKDKEGEIKSKKDKEGEIKSKKEKGVIDTPRLTLENYDKIVVGDEKTGKGGSTYEDVVSLLGSDASYKSSTMSKVKLDEFEWFDNDMMLADESLNVKFKDGLVFEKTFKEDVIWTE
jgi:cytoskeletal protein RodZ